MLTRSEILNRLRSARWPFLLLLASIFHLLIFQIYIPESRPLAIQDNHEPIEIDSVNEKPFARSSRPVDQSEKNKDAQARFGGEKKNRVDKETRSPNQGPFRQGQQGQPAEPDGEEGLAMKDLLPQRSSQNAVLPDDVELGQETLLHTDPILYASFLNRIQEEIYGPWNRHLGDAMKLRENDLGANIYVTRLKVEVDRQGNIVSMNTIKSSGVREIDSAPKEAFWEIEPFDNPPMSKDRDAETLPFVFEFHFHVEKSLFGGVKWIL